MSDDYAEELDVDFSTAVLSTVQLTNASAFAMPIALAKVGMKEDHFSTHGTIAVHLKSVLSTVGEDLYYLQNQLPDQTLDASIKCGEIAGAFLEFIGKLWGYDSTASMVILSQMYNPDKTDDQTSNLEDIWNFLSDPSFLLAMAGIGSAFIPGVGWYISAAFLTGAVVYGEADLLIKAVNGEISWAQFGIYTAITAGLTALGGGAIASEGRILMLITKMSEQELAQVFEQLIILTSETAAGAASGFDSSVETAMAHLRETFMNDFEMSGEQADQLIQQLRIQGQQNGPIGTNPYAVDIPAGVDTKLIPTYSGEPGPAYIPVDGSDEITTSVINKYPDFIAWMNARESEYKAQLPAGFDVDPVSFAHFIEGQDHIPDNYRILAQAAFRNVDPRWFIYN